MHISTDMPHESFMSYLSKFRIWFYNEYQNNIHDNIEYIYRYVLIYEFDVIMNIISKSIYEIKAWFFPYKDVLHDLKFFFRSCSSKRRRTFIKNLIPLNMARTIFIWYFNI